MKKTPTKTAKPSPTPYGDFPVPHIYIQGARAHNLRNIDLRIPKNQLVVITGISGSGKSSLAFDTLFAEGQRRYMESFAHYARQFLGDLQRPDVDRITGLSPVISIEQKTTNRNPRSTVGTVTEVYDFLRLLYARVAEAYSYVTGKKMIKLSREEMQERIEEQFDQATVAILAPLVRGRKGHYRELFTQLRKQGYLKVSVDGEIRDLDQPIQLDRYKVHDIELVIDRLVIEPSQSQRLKESLEKGLEMGEGLLFVLNIATQRRHPFSRVLMCADSGISYEEPSPNHFSFNSPYGACPQCHGLGLEYAPDMDKVIPDPHKTIREGGIVPLRAEKNSWTFRNAQRMARKKQIPLDVPIAALDPSKKNWILYGNPQGHLPLPEADAPFISLQDEEKKEYEGILPLIMRWFRNTEFEPIRNWALEYLSQKTCTLCQGARLKQESLHFKLGGLHIGQVAAMPIGSLLSWFDEMESGLPPQRARIAHEILKEIRDRVQFLQDVGLHYLSLHRPSRSLSGGESQRIRLATQIGSQLTGITYILDEPSIGLHQRDNENLIGAMKNLRDGGNSVIVVEHDRDIMMAADYLIDMGPAAGIHGGQIIAQGIPEEVKQSPGITAEYLRDERSIPIPPLRRKGNGQGLKLSGAKGHNLKNVQLHLPLGCLIAVTGVSGSGKSSLINETLYPLLARHVYPQYTGKPLAYKKIEGLENIDKVIEIDQSPIGRTPRSNPATYCGFFTDIRHLFSQVPEARIRGYQPGRFSFNVKGGRCESCSGAGIRTIEMNFLPDVYVPCETCGGKRYNRETLEIRYKGKSIYDVLNMTVEEAAAFFAALPSLHRKIKVLDDVGLGYIQLGQSAVTLSGGEAQRIKLATELAKRDTGKTIYILDEPTTGLHFEDIRHLLDVLQRLVDRGNTVLVIEHNLDIIKMADHVVDIGPEGGEEGGRIVGSGTPEEIAAIPQSHTGRYLKEILSPP